MVSGKIGCQYSISQKFVSNLSLPFKKPQEDIRQKMLQLFSERKFAVTLSPSFGDRVLQCMISVFMAQQLTKNVFSIVFKCKKKLCNIWLCFDYIYFTCTSILWWKLRYPNGKISTDCLPSDGQRRDFFSKLFSLCITLLDVKFFLSFTHACFFLIKVFFDDRVFVNLKNLKHVLTLT